MELPDVLKVSPLKRPLNQSTNTDILQPTTFSQTSCKFVLPNTGILDSNSQLHLSQIVVNSDNPAVDSNSYYPNTLGAAACIQRCYLTIGGKEICDTQDCNHFLNWKRHHYSNEYKKGVAMPHTAGNDVYLGSAGRVDNANFTQVQKNARGFLPPYGTIGKETSEYGIVLNSNIQFARQNNDAITNTDKEKRLIPYEASRTPGMLIPLSALIPALVGVQLPLGMIEQEVAIVIEWAASTWGHRFMYNGTDKSGAIVDKTLLTSTIVENDVFLVLDTLYYPGLMEDIKEQIYSRGGYSLSFDSVITQQNYLQYKENEGATQKDFQIPLAGKKVKRVIVQKSTEQENIVETLTAGYYNSLALRKGEEYQFRIDSKNVYSLPISNTSLQRCEANAVEGIPLVLNSHLYSFRNTADDDGDIAAGDETITTRLCNSHTMANDCGSQHYIGLKVENAFGQGHLMGIQPVIYSEKSILTQYDAGTGTTPNRESDRVVRFFVVHQKIMNINSGIVETID